MEGKSSHKQFVQTALIWVGGFLGGLPSPNKEHHEFKARRPEKLAFELTREICLELTTF